MRSSAPILARLCQAMARTDLAVDPRFGINVHRVEHHVATDAIVTG